MSKTWLISQEQKQYQKWLQGAHYDPQRRTGRSTAQALSAIAQAIACPGKLIGLHDHAGTRQATGYLMDVIRSMILQLDLQGLVLDKQNQTIMFNLYEPCSKCQCSQCVKDQVPTNFNK